MLHIPSTICWSNTTENIFCGCQPNERIPALSYTFYQRSVLSHIGEIQCGFVALLDLSCVRQFSSFSENNYSETTYFPVL